jgi:hypothetical protein
MPDALIRLFLLVAFVTADAGPRGGNGPVRGWLKGAPIEIVIP